MLTRLVATITSLFRGLTIRQRIGLIGGGAAVVGAVVLSVALIGAPRYERAYSGLDPVDAAAIADVLRESGIAYEVSAGGTAINVDGAQLDEARLVVAGGGVTPGSSGDGWSLFDGGTFGMSSFGEEVAYQRALTGELERTIGAMAGVSRVRVSFVPVDTTLFGSTAAPAQASVLITMRPGATANDAMVRAIQATVAGAVRGMAAENVSVIDSAGRTIGGPTGGDAPVAQNAAIVGRDLEAKIYGLLIPIVGVDGAAVSVHVEIDPEQSRTTTRAVDTVNVDAYPVVSQSCSTEHIGAGAPDNVAIGVPGANSNVPGLPTYPRAGGTAADGTPYDAVDCTTNFDNSYTETATYRSSGAIKRLGVSVVLDAAKAEGVDVVALKAAIESAIATDTARGDQVALTVAPFTPAPEANPIDSVGSLLPGLIAGVAAIAVLLIVLRSARRLGRSGGGDLVAIDPDGGLVDIAALIREARAASSGAGPISIADGTTPTEALRRIAAERPEALSSLITDWARKEERA
jgi:flagellar M-ring protein FliF